MTSDSPRTLFDMEQPTRIDLLELDMLGLGALIAFRPEMIRSDLGWPDGLRRALRMGRALGAGRLGLRVAGGRGRSGGSGSRDAGSAFVAHHAGGQCGRDGRTDRAAQQAQRPARP